MKQDKCATYGVYTAILSWELQSGYEGVSTLALSATYPFRNFWKAGREG